MLQEDPWLPWSPLSRTVPQKGISAHAGHQSLLGRLCALYTSKPEPHLGQSCWRLFIWLRKQEGNSTPRPAVDFGSGQSHLPEWGQSLQGLLQIPGGLCVTRTSLEGITCSSAGLSGMPCPGNDGSGLPVASPGGDSREEVESIGDSGPSMFPDGQTPRTNSVT